jgi:hypothetical protein
MLRVSCRVAFPHQSTRFLKFIYQDSLLTNQKLSNTEENLQMEATNFLSLSVALQESTDMSDLA